MEELLQRVGNLEVMIAKLVKWTNFEEDTDNPIPSNNNGAILNNDNIEIKLEMERENDDYSVIYTLPSSCEEVGGPQMDMGERRRRHGLSGNDKHRRQQIPFDPLADIPEHSSSSSNMASSSSLLRSELARSSTKRAALLKPKRTVHNETNVENNEGDDDPYGIHKCTICSKIFHRKYNLVRHLRTHRTERFLCSVCKTEFRTQIRLRQHLQVHERDAEECGGSRKFKLSCHLCDKKFTYKQSLEFHANYHAQLEQKPHSCEKCELRFRTMNHLQLHLDQTSCLKGGRTFPCLYCEKGFTRKYNLIRHELSHTQGRWKPKDGGMPIPNPFILAERERELAENKNQPQSNNSGEGDNSNSMNNIEDSVEGWTDEDDEDDEMELGRNGEIIYPDSDNVSEVKVEGSNDC